MLSVLFNDPTIFAYVRNTWSLRSLAKCLLQKSLISQSISFKHLQRILKDMGIGCKRPKKLELELEHDDGPDYDEGKKQVQNYKQV